MAATPRFMRLRRRKYAWWENTESKRRHFGRWEFYRDKRDWWIGVFFSGRGTYYAFLTLVAKRRIGDEGEDLDAEEAG